VRRNDIISPGPKRANGI